MPTGMHAPTPMQDASPIRGSGPMSEKIRAYPWHENALGPIEGWPPELLGSVNSMLTSKQIACLIWGEAEQVLLYNDLYVPLLGNKSPALGQNFLEVWSEIREQAKGIISEPFRTREANLFERVPFFILIDGEPVERICTLTNNPIWSMTGESRILGLYQTIVDYTDGELAVRELQKERELLTQVMAASRDAVTLVDREWRIQYMNPVTRRIVGPDRDLIGKNLWESFPAIAWEGSPCLDHFPRAMDEGIPASFETYYPEPYNFSILVDVYPTTGGMVTFVRDISDAKKAQAALIQNEKLAAVGRLAASIAHEINNPLGSVTNLLYLARGTEDAAVLQEYLAMAEQELRRVSIISNQTLRFYKQPSSSQTLTDQELFDSVMSIYQGRLVNSKIVVEKRSRARRPIECYDGEIRQVLNNLVGNAMDAMQPNGGRLLIRSRDAHNWKTGEAGMALTVADTGCGMPAEVLLRLFEAFYTTKGSGGNGLGLWVSQQILDRHKGTLRVRSSQKAGASGTVFTVFLPSEAAAR